MSKFTRREALKIVGGAAAATALRLDASAQAPSFPKGAVIRTLFKDYAPEELAGGATLFHAAARQNLRVIGAAARRPLSGPDAPRARTRARGR